MVDQRIEERESLRHSTHRSQRSDRMQGAHTATDRFGNTATDINNQNKGEDHHIQHPNEDAPEMYTEMPHQLEHHEHMFNDEEPSKMFTFEDGHHNTQSQDDKQSHKSGQQNRHQDSHQKQQQHNFHGAPSRTQQIQQQQHDNNMGHLMFVQSGRNHSLHLTRDGDVFSYGSGVQCAAGHGGARTEFAPTILKPLRDKRII